MVLEGTDAHSLKRGVGHLVSSAVPGEAGNVVLAGHRDTFFRPLRDVRVGDVIRLSTAESTRRYVVESATVVDPDRTEVLQPTPDPTLTLVTCFPFYFVGHAPERFIVKARELARAEIHTAALKRPLEQEERPSPLRAPHAQSDPPPPAPAASNPEPRRERHVLSRLNPVRAVGRLGRLFRRQPKNNAAPPE